MKHARHERPTTEPAPTGQGWPDVVDDIVDGDLAVALAHVTPAGGVVLTPLTNYALRDRQAGTVTVLSSLGAWKKLDRIRRNPRVTLAFHTRRHGDSDRPEYVLMQGLASFSTTPDRPWLESIGPNWERFMGSRDVGPIWERWMHVYHWERVGIELMVHRVIVWPDLACRGAAMVHGAPLGTSPPPPQRPPEHGTGPRIDHVRAARRAARLPDTLLGWVDTDGFPMVVPVDRVRSDQRGIVLDGPVVPPGGRRAGLTSHWFTPRVLGQQQHVHTGWLEPQPDGVVYAPHTKASYRLPASKVLYRTLVGGFTRIGLRRARRSGFLGPAPRRGKPG